MDHLGKPNTIKLINTGIIRNSFMQKTALSCAEISFETGISITTVRVIINEMLARGELLSLGLGSSRGGRRSEEFIINDNCYEAISFCITEHEIYRSAVNIHSEIIETKVFPMDKTQYLPDLISLLLNDRIRKKTKAVGIGVPGIVSSQGFISNIGVEVIDTVDILPLLKQRFDVPIIFENDLMASSLGFAQEIQAYNGSQALEGNNSTAAFIYFENQCKNISAGFVEGNTIIHGMGNYAGEVGLMPFDDTQDIREALYKTHDKTERMKIIAQLLSWICCTINPQHVMLCSSSEFHIDGDMVMEYTAKKLPASMLPHISISFDYKKYFIKGMTALSSAAIFNPPNNR